MVLSCHMPTPWVVPRLNKLPGRKKNTVKSLTLFCESLDHDRHHRRSIWKWVLWKEKRMRASEQYSEWEGMVEFLSKQNPLPALFCALWRICTSDWMTEWYTQWRWNLGTRVFILKKTSCPRTEWYSATEDFKGLPYASSWRICKADIDYFRPGWGIFYD